MVLIWNVGSISMAIEASALDAKPGAEVLEDFLKKEWVQNHFLEYKVWHWSAQNSLPSGKQPHKYGKSQFLNGTTHYK